MELFPRKLNAVSKFVAASFPFFGNMREEVIHSFSRAWEAISFQVWKSLLPHFWRKLNSISVRFPTSRQKVRYLLCDQPTNWISNRHHRCKRLDYKQYWIGLGNCTLSLLTEPEDLLLVRKHVRRMKGNKRIMVDCQIFEKAANLWPYLSLISHFHRIPWIYPLRRQDFAALLKIWQPIILRAANPRP